MGGRLKDESQETPTVHKEILIINPIVTVDCANFQNPTPRTCKINGDILGDGWRLEDTVILLDSGASFSCVSDIFLSKLPGKIDVCPPSRPSAVDASNNRITAIGDCFLTISVRTSAGSTELRRVRFSIFARLSVGIILGCEILSNLDFSLGPNFAFLSGRQIPRIMCVDDRSAFQVCELKLLNAVVLEESNRYITVVEAQADRECFASFPAGEICIHLLDEFTSNGVISPSTTGRYTSMQIVRTDDHGELKARSFLFTLEGHSSEVPTKLRALVAEVPSTQKSIGGDVLAMDIDKQTNRLSKNSCAGNASGYIP